MQTITIKERHKLLHLLFGCTSGCAHNFKHPILENFNYLLATLLCQDNNFNWSCRLLFGAWYHELWLAFDSYSLLSSSINCKVFIECTSMFITAIKGLAKVAIASWCIVMFYGTSINVIVSSLTVLNFNSNSSIYPLSLISISCGSPTSIEVDSWCDKKLCAQSNVSKVWSRWFMKEITMDLIDLLLQMWFTIHLPLRSFLWDYFEGRIESQFSILGWLWSTSSTTYKT